MRGRISGHFCVLFTALVATLALCFLAQEALRSTAHAQTRSWNFLTTGNGHGFQTFDRSQGRMTSFLENPYRYVAPGDTGRTWGVGRRDLGHDMYFGMRAGGTTTWLHDQSSVEYESQTHVIHASSSQSGVRTDTYYFAPFGYEGNGLVMLVRATNDGSSAIDVSLFVKPNLKLGQGDSRINPTDENEHIVWNGAQGIETGPGGGHVVYIPIGGVDQASCGADSTLYEAVRTGSLPSQADCTASHNVLVLQKDVHIEGGGEAWWGLAVLFVNDDPAVSQAADFRDDRTTDDIVSLWAAFAGDKDGKTLHDEAIAEFEAWRTTWIPDALDERERILWRQSEAILRMAQVREPRQSNRESYGMVLASLPPGEWHTGWVRDGAYGTAAFAMTGHVEQARLGLEFFLSADGATGGVFSDAQYLGAPYRVSATRHFGNGKEEGDWNNDGPNIETDGWGVMLWAARMYLHYSCNTAWLDTTTWRGDTYYDALRQVAGDIEAQVRSELPGADASIWEVHWNRRQVFAYTAAAHIRGLLDFADIADQHGNGEDATHFRDLANNLLERVKNALVYHPQNSFASHLGVASNPVHVDGSTVEFFNWYLVSPDDPLYVGTLNNYSKLLTGFGGYQRLEPQLSLTGEGSAGAYDVSEWILLDLRISQAWRRLGRTEIADMLLDKVTAHAAVNDFLVPELYDRTNGRYTGVVPMVGYGAGAWMMEQLYANGFPAPRYDATFAHCVVTPGEDGGMPGPGGPGSGPGVPGPGSGPGAGPGASPGGPGASPGGGPGRGMDGGTGGPLADGPASFCAVRPGRRGLGALAIVGLAGLALALRRRRAHS